jgi:hypothetical protein
VICTFTGKVLAIPFSKMLRHLTINTVVPQLFQAYFAWMGAKDEGRERKCEVCVCFECDGEY